MRARARARATHRGRRRTERRRPSLSLRYEAKIRPLGGGARLYLGRHATAAAAARAYDAAAVQLHGPHAVLNFPASIEASLAAQPTAVTAAVSAAIASGAAIDSEDAVARPANGDASLESSGTGGPESLLEAAAKLAAISDC